MRLNNAFWMLFLASILAGCGADTLTVNQSKQALEEVSGATQALNVASGTVEISTHFTIGQAVQAAAQELRDFIASQLPCADITLSGAKLTITYGAKLGNCTYLGQTYSGSHSVEIVSATAGNLKVHHEWTNVSNGKFSVTGTADVTWSAADSSRNVVHQLTWTRLPNGAQVVGSGNRTQTALPAGITVGFGESGDRNWTSTAGKWDLTISGIEIRWIDPVPQAGTYTLTTPFNGKTLTLAFSRVDDNTIAVTATTGRVTFKFNVAKDGTVTGG